MNLNMYVLYIGFSVHDQNEKCRCKTNKMDVETITWLQMDFVLMSVTSLAKPVAKLH